MVYENKKVVSVGKPLKDYTKKYIICVLSSQFWIVYDETNNPYRAKDIVNELEYDDNECIIIENKRKESEVWKIKL